MTTDPTTPLIRDLLPSDPEKLRALLLTEHDDRCGQLGERWWRILRDAYQSTGGFMRSVDAVNTRLGGPGNGDFGRGSIVGLAIVGRPTYLTPFRRESPEAFTARANRSAYANHIAPIIDVYHGHLVRRRAERASTIDVITKWWSNADGRGHDVAEWVAGVALRAQLNGWCAVLIDRPDSPDPTIARRTTATTLDPCEVRDWQVGLDGGLDWMRLVSEWCEADPATGEVVEYMEATLWTRTEWARVRMVEGESEKWTEVERTGGPHSVGRVPVAVLRWQEQLNPRALYGLSQVQGVVPLALALFQNESELTDHLANQNFSPLAVQSDDPAALENLTLGASNGIRYGTHEAAPSFIAPGTDVAMQYALRSEQLRAAIYTAAKMEPPGAKADGGDAASGIARAYDFSQTDAGLQTFARQLERFEHECASIVVAWDALGDATKIAAAADATTIAYPQRFDAAGIRDDLSAMFAVLDDKVRAQMPPTVIREARMGIARGLFPEASPAVEASAAAEVEGMYLADVAAMGAAHPDPAVAGAAAAHDAMAALPLADAGALTTATP